MRPNRCPPSASRYFRLGPSRAILTPPTLLGQFASAIVRLRSSRAWRLHRSFSKPDDPPSRYEKSYCRSDFAFPRPSRSASSTIRSIRFQAGIARCFSLFQGRISIRRPSARLSLFGKYSTLNYPSFYSDLLISDRCAQGGRSSGFRYLI